MRTITIMLKAWWLGFSDGWGEPWDLTVGMTYRDERAQRAWDCGANAGQWFGRITGKQPTREVKP